jgi:formylglycine-generating enzyme required for sulfatase activity
MKGSILSRITWQRALPIGLFLSVSFALFSNSQSSAQEQQAGKSRQLEQTATVTSWPGQAKRWALVVGVDQYSDGNISPLRGAANDAGTLARALTQYAGFPADQVVLLATDQPDTRQPTRINILTYLSNLASAVPKDGLLLVAFAGHGIERGGQAYLIPSDARLTDDVSLLEESAISVQRMHDRIRSAKVAQVVVLLDACRNDPGGRADAPNPLTAAYARAFNFDVRNREVQAFATLYATAIGQRAYEYQEKKQGYFTWAIVEGLKGRAANERGEVTLSGLVKYVQDVVPKRIAIDLGAGKQQRPFAVIEGYRADDLVVAVVEAPPTTNNTNNQSGKPIVSTANPEAVEQEYWDTIKSSKDVEDFRDYLKAYPTGTHAMIARSNLRRLEAAGKTSNNVSTSTGDSAGALSLTSATSPAPKPGTVVRSQIGIELVFIPPGSFDMGSNKSVDEKPVHRVTISRGFYMGKYEVTQGQWKVVMGSNLSYFKDDDALPVEQVSWNDAQEFIKKLNEMNDGYEYSLPTEAEWEYACRAGTTGDHYSEDIDDISWHKDNSERKPHGVGLKQPNAFGLYDMSGNVYEWCRDWYHKGYAGAPLDGSEWVAGGEQKYRVFRGGSWKFKPSDSRSANRKYSAPELGFNDLGFRLVAIVRTS